MLSRSHEYGDARKVRYAADVVPMGVRQENEAQAFEVVTCRRELVRGRL